MAKKSSIEKNKKRIALVKKYSATRQKLKILASDRSLSPEIRFLERQKLSSLPRDAFPNRVRNRCFATGRPRGFFRDFGLGRHSVRDYAINGLLPGVTPSTW